MKSVLRSWLSEDLSGMEDFLNTEEQPYAERGQILETERERDEYILHSADFHKSLARSRQSFQIIYRTAAALASVAFVLTLLFVIAHTPSFGVDDPHADAVAYRYIESGLEETGATNIVAGMILDYRAFDTLGESFVLFTALLCCTALLRIDKKNMNSDLEDYYTVRTDVYFDTSHDTILQKIGLLLVPFILLFGIYVLLNGHLSPGGGFSGGAIIGSGLIILSSSMGFSTADRIFTYKRLNILSFAALAFYSVSKCYVFFTGANGLPNHIPKGIPGAIFSAGLILPLNVAVGLVVACTMYGFYSLFRRGNIGGD